MPVGRKRSTASVLGRNNRHHQEEEEEEEKEEKGGGQRCCFCDRAEAAVAVRTSQPLHARTRTTTTVTSSYCLLHYYTTPAVRVPVDEGVVVVDPLAYEEQKSTVQSLFAEAFVQLQQELGESVARAASTTGKQQDPLAVLHHIHKKAQRKKPPPPKPSSAAAGGSPSGGFLREIAPPERLIKTQREQARKQQALLKRMERATTTARQQQPSALDARRPPDVSKRRKSSRRSIWNTVLDNDDNADNADRTTTDAVPQQSTAAAIHRASELHATAVCSSCGGDQVKVLASHSARDARKGEIWGGRDETSARVQCLTCGKTWNEEE